MNGWHACLEAVTAETTREKKSDILSPIVYHYQIREGVFSPASFLNISPCVQLLTSLSLQQSLQDQIRKVHILFPSCSTSEILVQNKTTWAIRRDWGILPDLGHKGGFLQIMSLTLWCCWVEKQGITCLLSAPHQGLWSYYLFWTNERGMPAKDAGGTEDGGVRNTNSHGASESIFIQQPDFSHSHPSAESKLPTFRALLSKFTSSRVSKIPELARFNAAVLTKFYIH